ncbi:MAG: glycoside hydrolase family 99-like domain-containing protein [Clostridia bacterium]|nr:glycoside hydrolase family 99-like domain-containing protein [Clostridia bacterium]
MKKKYDIAAYIWPAYTGKEMRTRIFWPDGIGEWQTVRDSVIDYPEHNYHWDRKPLWGYQDEADPKVMEFQIEEATRHGVNVFIYDWYWYDGRPFLSPCLDEGFLKAENRHKMQFYIMWANHDVNYGWNKPLADTIWENNCNIWGGAVDRKQFEKIVDLVIKKYFSEPNYYKIDGKPVFMLYDVTNFVVGLGGIDGAVDALNYFRQKTVEAGFPGLEVQLAFWSERMANVSGFDGYRVMPMKEVIPALGLDSMTNYQFCHYIHMKNDYPEILAAALREWNRIDQEYNIPYYPHVSVGWDNNPRFNKFMPMVCRKNTPEEVEKAFRAAREYVDTHSDTLKAPLITVNSWNEWTETSYLEPDNVFGYGYLEAVKKVFVDEAPDIEE